MQYDSIFSSAILGSVVLLGGSFFLPGVIAILSAFIVVAYLLRYEQIYRRSGITTSAMFLSSWMLTRVYPSIQQNFIEGELFGLFLFGIVGLVYSGIQLGVQRIGSAIYDVSIGGLFSYIGTSLFGAALVGAIGFQIKRMISVKNIVSIGLVPGMLLNLSLRQSGLGLISEFFLEISSVATVGFILSTAFTLDAVSHAISTTNSLLGKISGFWNEKTTDAKSNGDNRQSNPTGRKQVKHQNNLNNMPDQEFLKMVISLAKQSHDEILWHYKRKNGIYWIYANSGTVDQLIVLIRSRHLSQQPDKFGRQVLQEIKIAVDNLDSKPQSVSLCTDMLIKDKYYAHLQKRGLQVVDGNDINNVMSQGN